MYEKLKDNFIAAVLTIIVFIAITYYFVYCFNSNNSEKKESSDYDLDDAILNFNTVQNTILGALKT